MPRYIAYRVKRADSSGLPGAMVCRPVEQELPADEIRVSPWVHDEISEFDADDEDEAWEYAERQVGGPDGYGGETCPKL